MMVFGTIRSAHACIALGQMHRFFAMEAPSHTASYATYPQTTSNNIENHSWGNPSKYHYTWFSPGIVPNLFIFHPISSMFFSCPSKELPIPMALRGRGKTG